jgi:hypothetical protein
MVKKKKKKPSANYRKISFLGEKKEQKLPYFDRKNVKLF